MFRGRKIAVVAPVHDAIMAEGSADQVEDLSAALDQVMRDAAAIVLRGYGDIGVNGLKNPIDVYIACWEWGQYLGASALADGVDVCVSSWNRLAPNTLPALAKAGANYMNSQLIKMETIANGYSEGIALDTAGYVSEGSGEVISKDKGKPSQPTSRPRCFPTDYWLLVTCC